jgi:hypothetical protein
MLIGYKRGQTSIILRVKVLNSSVTTGAGLTGLTSASSGLIISTIADNEATATAYTVAGSTIESITTLGTFATPTATKCRFKEVDATNHKGVYEIQLDNARYAVSSAKSLLVSLVGATNLAETDVVIPLRDLDPYDAVRAGLTALPNAAAEAPGGLYTRGSGAGQINQPANGQIDANTVKVSGTAQTARDLGASVLLSSGTGTGQISLSSGAVLLQATQTGVTIPTVTTLTNAPPDSSGVTTLLSRIPSTLFSGITSLAQWLGMIAGKQVGNSTARTEIRATGAGSGTYDETTDSQEATRDNMGTAQTGDSYARLGAPAGASVSADIAAVSTAVAAVPTANANADALLDRSSAVDTYTPRGILRLIGASLLGQLAGAATTTITAKAADASKTRITATVDANGNRTAVTLDAT